MKKIVISLAVMLLFVATLMVMSACGGTSETTTEPATTTTEPATTTTVPAITSTVPVVTTTTPETTEPTIPEGYTLYQNEGISFAYPENYVKASDMMTDATTGNNVNVITEAKNDYYATMDLAAFNRDLVPVYESMGMTVSNISVAQTKNAAGLAISKFSYTTTIEGISMKMTQFITTVGQKTYTVTVTEVVSDADLANNVFNTLNQVK